MPTTNLDNLEKFVSRMNQEVPTMKDFEDAIQKILDLVQAILARHEQGIKELQETHEKLVGNVRDETSFSLSDIKGQVNDLFVGSRLQEIEGKNRTDFESMNKTITDSFGELSQKQKNELLGLKDNTMKTFEKKLQEFNMGMKTIELGNKVEIDSKLAAFKEDVKKDLKELKEMLGRITETRSRGSQGMGMRKVPIIRAIDLTSQVDGIVTAFTVPRDTVRVLGLFGTQFPITFRIETDFTYNANTITLVTAQVGTPQSGQTLWALVETLFYA